MMNRMISSIGMAAVALGLLMAAQVAAAVGVGTVMSDRVLLISVKYVSGGWSAAAPRILLCESPSKPQLASPDDSMIRVFDVGGKQLYQLYQFNPRFILVDDQKQPPLLDTVDFDLRLPYFDGMGAVEFWESAKQQKPSFRIDVSSAPVDKNTTCQVPNMVPNQL